MEWCLGQLSGPRLKRNLRRQVMDNDAVGNYSHPLLVRLAKAGGSNSQNIHRSLMKLLVNEGFKTLVVEVCGAHIKYMVPPHRLIHSLSKTFPAKAQATLGLDSDLLFRFGDSLRSTDDGLALFAEHGYLQGKTPMDLKLSAPCTWHEDAGPYTKCGSVHLLQFSSMFGSGTDIDIKNFVAMHLKGKGPSSHPDILDPAWVAIFQSLDALANGMGVVYESGACAL